MDETYTEYTIEVQRDDGTWVTNPRSQQTRTTTVATIWLAALRKRDPRCTFRVVQRDVTVTRSAPTVVDL